MEAANSVEIKTENHSESTPAVKFNAFKDEIPNLFKERHVSFSKNVDTVNIPLDGPNSPSATDVSHTVSNTI